MQRQGEWSSLGLTFSFPCRRGSMLSTAIFVYAATSPVNGYFGGSLYAKQGGNKIVYFLTNNICVTCPAKAVCRVLPSDLFIYFFGLIQAGDGLNKCSLGPLWSQPWCAGLPFSSTSLLSTTTLPEPSHLEPWWDFTLQHLPKNHNVMKNILQVKSQHFNCVAA